MKTDSELAVINARREAWAEIGRIKALPISDRLKLEKCLNVGRVHCALTGDDSLLPPQVRGNQDGFLKDELPPLLKRAQSRRRDREHGIVPLLG